MTTLNEIMTPERVSAFREDELFPLDDALFDQLYDFFRDQGLMPYPVARAQNGMPYQHVEDWIEERLEREYGIDG